MSASTFMDSEFSYGLNGFLFYLTHVIFILGTLSCFCDTQTWRMFLTVRSKLHTFVSIFILVSSKWLCLKYPYIFGHVRAIVLDPGNPSVTKQLALAEGIFFVLLSGVHTNSFHLSLLNFGQLT